jgi:hypothetical protein
MCHQFDIRAIGEGPLELAMREIFKINCRVDGVLLIRH